MRRICFQYTLIDNKGLIALVTINEFDAKQVARRYGYRIETGVTTV